MSTQEVTNDNERREQSDAVAMRWARTSLQVCTHQEHQHIQHERNVVVPSPLRTVRGSAWSHTHNHCAGMQQHATFHCTQRFKPDVLVVVVSELLLLCRNLGLQAARGSVASANLHTAFYHMVGGRMHATPGQPRSIPEHTCQFICLQLSTHLLICRSTCCRCCSCSGCASGPRLAASASRSACLSNKTRFNTGT